MTLPYKLGGTPRTAAERADLARFRAARRSRYCRQAEREHDRASLRPRKG